LQLQAPHKTGRGGDEPTGSNDLQSAASARHFIVVIVVVVMFS